MGLMGKLRRVDVKIERKLKEDRKHFEENDDDVERFLHRPARVDRTIENGKEYRAVSYDETRPVDDLLPDETKVLETSTLTKELTYVLILDFDAPIQKP